MLELAIRLILGCGVVIVALLGLRYASNRGMTARGGPVLRIVGRTGLTKSALVAVIDVDDRRFLIGAAEQGVQLLADLGPAAGDGTATPDATRAATPDLLRAATPDLMRAATPDDTPVRPLDLDDLDLLEASWAAPDAGTTDMPDATHGQGHTDEGPRIGPLDRLREMTVRSHLREPIRAPRHLRR